MQNLLKIATNTVNHEAYKIEKPKGRAPSYKAGMPRYFRRKRIAYKINGYWFHLTRKDWAEFTGLSLTTIVGRVKAGKPPGQILGYEELPSGVTKRGRPCGVKNK